MSDAAFQPREGASAAPTPTVRRRLSGALSRLRELFPWTPLGVVLTAAAYAALEWFAYAQLDRVWLIVGYVGLGLTLVSPITVLGAAAWLKLRDSAPASSEPWTLETGRERATEFTLPSLWYLPLVQLRWRWLSPPAAEVWTEPAPRALRERVRVHERGRYGHIERLVAVSDPFGISRVTVHLKESRALDVLPRIDGLRSLPSLISFASGDAVPHPMGLEDGDRLELSRYTPGDPARFIHWKVLGRTRKLMVRRPERALSVARRMAAFLIAGDDDDATAGVARLAIEKRLLGSEWSFGTDLEPGGTSEVTAALGMVMDSPRGRERGGEGLSPFIDRVLARGPASLLVFAPPQRGPWLERVGIACRSHKLRVLIGVDRVVEERPAAWWRRLLALPSAPRGLSADALEEVVSELARAGADVVVLDRRSGRELTREHRRGMRLWDAAAARSDGSAASAPNTVSVGP